MRDIVCTLVGLAGGTIAAALGGWDTTLQVLIICMAIDFLSGAILALVFQKSPKSPSGGYSSSIGAKGFFKKCAILLGVVVCCQIDKLIGTDFARDAGCIGFAFNEILSIVENLGLMGVPMPKKVMKALDAFMSKEEE